MTSAVYDQALYHLGIGEVNWTTASRIWIVATGNTAPTKTHAHYSQIGGEIANGNGYATGGKTDTAGTVTIASNICWFDAPDISWTSATFTGYYVIAQWGATSTTATNPLMCYLDTGAQAVSNGTYTCTWYTSGLFSLTSTAAA